MQNDAAIQVMQRLSTIRVPPGTVLTAPRKKDTVSATQGKQPAKAAPEVLTTPTGMQPLDGVAQ
jgi:hypothetical protein